MMRFNGNVVRSTSSVCPVCLERIDARMVERNGNIYMEKECPRHGAFSTVVWKCGVDYSRWIEGAAPLGEGENLKCPNNCGICPEHRSKTCCVLFEVTERCDLSCGFCFANKSGANDPPIDELRAQMERFIVKGETLLQLSGGEPSMRDDLPDLVKEAKKLGCKYVQLNSNGIRLAEDTEYVRKLAEAGLSFVFMQFDGLNDETYEKLRGRPLFAIKERAIKNCADHNLGVTLVPTVVPRINTDEIGGIISFAIKNSPAVRGVHFQPVTYSGRIPRRPADRDRFTLDELLTQIERQTQGMISIKNILPSRCDHPMCGFHGDFVVQEDGTLYPLSEKNENAQTCCCGHDSLAARNREFVARRWQREPLSNECCLKDNNAAEHDINDMEYFLERVKSHGFTVTAMAFQDAGNLDIERLRMCSLHVFKDGRLVPFCANYLGPLC